MAARNVARQWALRSRPLKRCGPLPLIACAIVALSLSSPALADEEEQGLSYSCDADRHELKIATVWGNGSGAKNPFAGFEQEASALWNIDRLDRALPIIKSCTLGRHQIVTVISQGCISGQGGFSPKVSLYANVSVTVDEKGRVQAEGHAPFAEAAFFGSVCDPFGALAFSDIVVGVDGADGRSLTVQMK